jgi:hypothetical protein
LVFFGEITFVPHAPGYTTDGRVNVSAIATGAVWSYSTDGGATFTTGTRTSFTLTGDGVKNVLTNQSCGSGDVSPNASLTFTLETSPPNFFNSDNRQIFCGRTRTATSSSGIRVLARA